jgi:hypothetical protein
MAHLVPEKTAVIERSPILEIADSMRSRSSPETEAINRLTDGVQPAVMRAILVQCLLGEVAPSAAIARMLAQGEAHTVRAAIDEVTLRAATISRASDMLVHDRVDELTQIFVENLAGLADVSDATKESPAATDYRTSLAPPHLGAGDQGETRISE